MYNCAACWVSRVKELGGAGATAAAEGKPLDLEEEEEEEPVRGTPMLGGGGSLTSSQQNKDLDMLRSQNVNERLAVWIRRDD